MNPNPKTVGFFYFCKYKFVDKQYNRKIKNEIKSHQTHLFFRP